MQAEMRKYLAIAEKVYCRISNTYFRRRSLVTQLDKIWSEVRREAQENNLKLMYNNIDFEDCLHRPINQRKIKIDLSILPDFKKKDETILWLTNFIESISVKTNFYQKM
ncbi:hypothetical protein ACEN3H_05490 [Acinetobacter lactucae]|uniref:hypothetical protein n=1 Tax=Acinetobacter lactucae TaxID=1785128 RepID=UPI00358DD884